MHTRDSHRKLWMADRSGRNLTQYSLFSGYFSGFGTGARNPKLQSGVSLVELIVFIVIVSVAVAGVLTALNLATRASADPLVKKQALALAEALLEEIELMPFTYCDPNDPQAATATSATVGPTGCLVKVEALGPEAAFSDPNPPNTAYQSNNETRYSTDSPFDNVNDYNGYDTNADTPPGIKDVTGTPIPTLSAYRAQVSVVAQGLGSGGTAIAATDANGAPQSLLITVTVTGPGNTTVVLQGYRTRYAPTALP